MSVTYIVLLTALLHHTTGAILGQHLFPELSHDSHLDLL